MDRMIFINIWATILLLFGIFLVDYIVLFIVVFIELYNLFIENIEK